MPDRLKRSLWMLIMGLLMGIALPWMLVQSDVPRETAPDLPALWDGMEVQALSEPLPQCYRVEDAEGNVIALTPQELLVRLAAAEWSTWAAENGSQEDARAGQALALRMVLLHSRALGLMGDRTEGMAADELTGEAWLRSEEMPVCGEETVAALPEEIYAALYLAAETAAPYFLSIDGTLIRDTEKLSLGEIYNRMCAGETAAEIVKEAFGENCLLEQAADILFNEE